MDKLTIPAGEKEQLDIYTQIGPFDKGIAALKKENLSIWTARDLAEARMLGGSQHRVSRKSSWVGENLNYLPDGSILVASRDYNPMLKNPEEATACHRNRKVFYLDQKIAKDLRERAESDPKKALKSGVLFLPRKGVKYNLPSIQSDALKDEPLTYFLFQDTAKPYGQFLKENGIDSVTVFVVEADYTKRQNSAFGHALWVGSLDNRSGLEGGLIDLHDGVGRVRGGRRSPAEERTAPEVSQEAKGLENIVQALKECDAFKYDGTTYVPVLQNAIIR